MIVRLINVSVWSPVRYAAGSMPRFMSARVPLPEPKWEQSKDIDEVIPADIDQITGLERAEMLAEMEGREIFDKAPIGPHGTKENPALVESIFDYRHIGCVGGGGPEGEHEVRWLVVKKGEQATCPECHQVFELKPVEGEEYKF